MGLVRGDSRDQGTLFPVSLDELVPEDHVCRVIDAFVESLGLAELGSGKARPAGTRPTSSPKWTRISWSTCSVRRAADTAWIPSRD